MKIFIAAGHGGKDPGAAANQTTEAQETVKIVDKVVEILAPIIKSPHRLIKVPHEFNLADTVGFINRWAVVNSSDICIEVHMNSNRLIPGTGVEVLFGYKDLAQTLQKNLVKHTGLKDRGIKERNDCYFNNATIPGSAIVELGFINNAQDLPLVREKGALALAAGITDFLKILSPTSPGLPPTTPTYKQKFEKMDQKFKELVAVADKLYKEALE